MTLVLSEVSRLGIAMAADSALTFGTLGSNRIVVGGQKILRADAINAGVAIWGNFAVNGEEADTWVARFIEEYAERGMSPWTFAEKLASALTAAYGVLVASKRAGIHVAAFDELGGMRGPALYHVHNGHYHHGGYADGRPISVPDETPPLREFRAHRDVPPAQQGMLRNGDFGRFAVIQEKLGELFERLRDDTSLRIPFPETLEMRGELLRFFVRTTIDMYKLSDACPRPFARPVGLGEQGIGGPVTVLTIGECGIESFYSY